MAIGLIVKTVLGAVAKPLMNIFESRNRRKAAQDEMKSEQASRKHEIQLKHGLSEAEWEQTQARGQDKSWKDEATSITVVYFPFAMAFFGGIYAAVTGDPFVLEALSGAFASLDAIPSDFKWLMIAVALSTVGIRELKRL